MKFTKEELDNIISDYNNGMCPKDLSEKYNKNSGTIIGKLQDLGIYKNTKHKYTKDDIEFLKEYYPKGDFDSIFKRFPNATIQSIQVVCSKYKISADYFNDKKWTKEELDILEKYYYEKSLEELIRIMNNRHTGDAIQTKALKYFGYSKDRSWSEEEFNILKTYYPIESVDEVCKRLPKRTRMAIIRKANNLGIKSFLYNNTYWSDEETQFLIDNWESMSDNELAEKLNVEKRTISERRWRLGLSRIKRGNEASYEDIKKFIRGNIGIWKKESMKQCDYKCVLTENSDFHIHHLYSFSLIFEEVLEENSFELKDNFCDYTEQELSFILQKFIDKQNEYPLGVCVDKEIHSLFHSLYGRITTPDMWYRFVEDFKNGNIRKENITYTN